MIKTTTISHRAVWGIVGGGLAGLLILGAILFFFFRQRGRPAKQEVRYIERMDPAMPYESKESTSQEQNSSNAPPPLRYPDLINDETGARLNTDN